MEEKGKPTAIYLPNGLNQMIESTRAKLGMNRSRFIQYCILKTLQELNVMSANVHNERATKNTQQGRS
jgi:hypothetical protein